MNNDIKLAILLSVAISTLILLGIAGYFLYQRFAKSKNTINSSKNDSNDQKPLTNDVYEEEFHSEKKNRSDEKDILLIFDKGDDKENNGRSKHENVKNKINEIRKDVEKFYDHNIEFKTYTEKTGDAILGYTETNQSKYFLKNSGNLIQNFKNTKFETQHNFIQYFFPSKSISKSGDNNAPYVQDSSLINKLIKNNQISIDDIKNRFENFSSALTFYLETTGIHYAFPKNAEKAQKQQIITDNIQQEIKNELINGSSISHNQSRITRMIKSIDLHLQFLKYAREAFAEDNQTTALNQLKEIEDTFNSNLNEYIKEIFEYISELSKSKNNKNSADFQAEAFVDLLIDIDQEFKNKKDMLNEIEKNLLKNINRIRKDFKEYLFNNLSEDCKNKIKDKVEQFISQTIKINSSSKIADIEIT